MQLEPTTGPAITSLSTVEPDVRCKTGTRLFSFLY